MPNKLPSVFALLVDALIERGAVAKCLMTSATTLCTRPTRKINCGFDTTAVLEAWQHLPVGVLRSERNRRTRASQVLTRNEIERDYAYNRALFRRVEQGGYQFNLALQVRVRIGAEQGWMLIFQRLNLRLTGVLSACEQREAVDDLFALSGMGKLPIPIAVERWHAAYLETKRKREEAQKRQEEERAAYAAALAKARQPQRPASAPSEPPWGMPAAK